jgi:cytochrome c oxidase cbb3-type subunit 3
MRMKKRHSLAAALVLAGWLPLLGSTPVAADDAAAAKPQENYGTYCKKCHGEHGKGDGPGAAMLKPKPRDFADCENMQKRSDDELFKVISEGGEAVGMSADMQPWGGTLSDDDIHALVKFVRSFCRQPAPGGGPKQ